MTDYSGRPDFPGRRRHHWILDEARMCYVCEKRETPSDDPAACSGCGVLITVRQFATRYKSLPLSASWVLLDILAEELEKSHG